MELYYMTYIYKLQQKLEIGTIYFTIYLKQLCVRIKSIITYITYMSKCIIYNTAA